jgi:hypothetical protein
MSAETDTNDERETYHSGYDDEDYFKMGRMGDAVTHILRGSCDELVGGGEDEDPHECPFNASYRKVEDGDISERCQIHVPDEWRQALDCPSEFDYQVIDLRAGCERWTGTSGSSSAFESDDPNDFDGGAGPCGDRAFVSIQHPDDSEPRHYCRRHARGVWIDRHRTVPHDPTLRE